MSKWIQILQRLSIGLKLTISFIFLLIVIAVIGITGIQQIYSSQEQTDVVFESGIEPLALTNTISVEFLMTRVKLREAFINEDVEKMKMYLTDASQHVKKHNQAVEEYRKTLITDEGRKLLSEYVYLFQQFEIVGSDITNALYAGNREDAVNILRGRCVEISDQLLSKYNEVLENKKTMLETLKQQTSESNQKAVQWQLLMVAIGVILSIMLSVIITLSLTKPIKKLMEIAKFFSIAENYERNSKAKTEMVGYLQANIGKDEIAQLTNSFADMIETVQDNYIQIKQKNEQSNVLTQEASILKQESEERENHLRDNIKVILQSVQAFAQGDLTTEVKGTETGTYTSSTIATLISEYNRALANVREMIIQIVGSINDVANGVKQISGSTEQLSAGIHEQSAQVAEISVAVEEMSSTIESNAQLSSRIAGDARKATEEAQNGGDAIKKMIANVEAVSKAVIESAENIERLGKSSEQIGEIVQVIDEIADQTNLLALNAAIEAARAGEQGRGFAVVADEVRKLAERTQLATKEISQKIAVIRQETTLSVQTMNKGKELVQAGDIFVQQTNTSLHEIIGHSQKVADLVSQLAAANEQQATTSHQVAKNIATVASVVHQSAAATSEIADNTSQLDRLTYEVIDLIQQFRTENNSRVIGNSLQGQRMLIK